MKKFLAFEKAREKARTLGLKSQKEWHNLSIPHRAMDLPSHPEKYYLKDWISWPDFLGYERQRKKFYRRKKWASFWQAKKVVKSKGFTSSAQYQNWIREENPKGLPTEPQYTYSGWKSWADFLGREEAIRIIIKRD